MKLSFGTTEHNYITVKYCNRGLTYLDCKRKEIITTWLIVVLIATLVGSIVFMILGYFKIGLASGGIFMLVASFLAEWTRDKSAVYLHKKEYKR